MAQEKGWFASHFRGLLRGILLYLALMLAAVILFIAIVSYVWSNQPATSNRAALVDLDGDGDLDAVLANGVNEGKSKGTIWINQGGAQRGRAGRFIASSERLGDAEYRNLAVGDLDGDGDADILLGNTWWGMDLFINQGGAQGGQPAAFKYSQKFNAQEFWGGEHPIALGDLDGDGDLDIFSGSCCGGMMFPDKGEPYPLPAANALWLNLTAEKPTDLRTGGPYFATPWVTQAPMDGTEALALGDLDGDGDLDVFMAKTNEITGPNDQYHRRTAYQVWWNDGRGNYTPGDQILDCPNVRDLAVGDLAGDGDLEALAATVQGGQVILNQGGAQGGKLGQFAIQPGSLGSLLTNSIALGDLNGDGSLDALLGSMWGQQAQTWLNDSHGHFRLDQAALRFPQGYALSLGDVDGDGDLDVFAGHLADDYRVWRNNGAGRLTADR